MSPHDVGNWGFVALFVGLIGYLVANRVASLRRFRRVILVSAVLLFLASLYVNRGDVISSFRDGWDLAGRNR
jgi:hypothetical protein